MYRTTLNPYPIRTSRVSAPYSRIASPRTVVGDVDVFRLARDISGDTYRPSTLLSNPSQLVDPELRGGDALFPNLRVGRFGREALAEDLTPYRVAKMFRPDVINMASTNPARQVKALEDIQFQKAGQSPGQAKALGELIRKDPTLGNSFNIGYGSTLNREQGLAQKEGRVYEFDPTDEMWKSGFKRKNPSIVAMDDLQDALMTMPSGGRLTTYDGRPLDPAFTKAYYNLEAAQDLNDPQLFYNLKGKADVDYGRIAEALDSVPKDINKKADYSLAKRWERVQGYSPYPPRGATYVLNADKPYQTVDQILNDVNQVEVSRSPRMADSRIARSQNSGNSDNNNIPKDFTRKEYLEATGDSDPLPPVEYSGGQTLVKLSDWEYADKNGYPMATSDVARAMRNPSTVVEDRSFILNEPQPQRPTTRLGTRYTEPYVNPYRRVLPQGEIELPNGMVVNQINPIKAPELAGMAWADESALYPNTSERIKGLDTYYRIAGQDYSLSNRDGSPLSANGDNYTYVKDFKTPEVILPSALAAKYQPYTGNMGYSPNNYRKATLGGKDVNNLDVTKLSRRKAKQLKDVGFYEFNDIMDEGVQISKNLDRLYQLNDLATPSDAVGDIAARTNDLIRTRKRTDGIKIVQPIGNIFEYIQPDVLDEIVMAERKQQDMGGTYRALTGSQDQGSFEQERMAYEGRPSALTQYNINDVLKPSFGSDYSGRANTGRIRVPSGIDYDAGIPIPTSRTRLASGAIDPIKLQDDFVEPFNQAQYTRDLIDRGGILIDTQLGVPILKALTTSFNPATQRKAIVNVGGAEVNTPKNITYLQPVRPSQVASGVANWQAPESLAVGRVGKQIPIQNIPELPTDTGMTVERRASSPMASIQRELINDNSVSLSPWFKAPLPSRNWTTTAQGQILYPNAGIGPINTGLKPKPFLSELFGFSAITPEGLAKYRDMG